MPRGAGGISLLWTQKEPQGLSERAFHKIPVGKLLKNQNPLALIVVAVIPDPEEVSESTAVSLRQKHLAVLEEQPHLLFWKALTPNSTKMVWMFLKELHQLTEKKKINLKDNWWATFISLWKYACPSSGSHSDYFVFFCYYYCFCYSNNTLSLWYDNHL